MKRETEREKEKEVLEEEDISDNRSGNQQAYSGIKLLDREGTRLHLPICSRLSGNFRPFGRLFWTASTAKSFRRTVSNHF